MNTWQIRGVLTVIVGAILLIFLQSQVGLIEADDPATAQNTFDLWFVIGLFVLILGIAFYYYGGHRKNSQAAS